MSLRTRVLLILAGMWFAFSLIIYSGSSILLSSRFQKQEQQEVSGSTERALKAFYGLKNAISVLSTDWGQWDDAWEFYVTKSQKFIDGNFQQPTFENAKLNMILFFDPAGNLFYGRNFNLEKRMFVPVPQSILSRIHTENPFPALETGKLDYSGIMKLPEGLLIFTTSPVLQSNGQGPLRGFILMGYYLQPSHIETLSHSLEQPLHFYSLPLQNAGLLAARAEAQLSKAKTILPVLPEDHNTVWGFANVTDINGKPVALLGIESPRVLFNQGMNTLKLYLVTVLVLGIIVLLTVWLLLKRYVLDRLINVSQQVIKIRNNSSFSQRIQISGADELGSMVSALNSLVSIIELTEEQLKSRIAKRTEKLEHLSVLNKNMFAQINTLKTAELQFREQEKLLKQFAYYDQLTGLPNRSFFRELSTTALERARRTGAGLVLMFLDADNFKQINDNWGHAMGDAFLTHMANQIRKTIKESDVVGRYAGDEFMIFLNNLKEKSIIVLIAEKLLRSLREPLLIQDKTIASTFSVGISVFPDDGQTLDELEQQADIAMYHAKRKKGDTWFFASDLEKKIMTAQEHE